MAGWTGSSCACANQLSTAFLTDITALGKVGLIICGNHGIRACVASMRKIFGRILKDGGLSGVEEDIASVSDIFELRGDPAMRKLESDYLR